jgi:hypothetical protein
MYYYALNSSRAATIFWGLWGRLATCGRLLIRLPPVGAPLRSEKRLYRLRLAAMWGGLSTRPGQVPRCNGPPE